MRSLYKILAFPYRALRWMMLARPIRFTRFGTFYILFSIGVGAAAINTGNNLLYLILGILLGLIILSGFLSDSGLWGIRTEWGPVGSLYAGEKALMECRVHKGWFPGVAVIIETHWKGLPPLYSFAPWIPAKKSVALRTSLTPTQRGYLTLESCHYSTRFPFGLFQKSHIERKEDRWLVYPKIQPLPSTLIERQGKDPSRESSSRQGLGSVPLVLRDYRTGDALRQVHWKTSAKRQRFIVMEMEEEASEGDLFYLDSWPAHLDAKAMEEFISFVASLVFSAYAHGRPVGLIVPGRCFLSELSRPHLHRILEYLALVDPSGSERSSRLAAGMENRPVMDIISLWRSYGH